MKKSINILLLLGMVFGCVSSVYGEDIPISVEGEGFVVRTQNDLDDFNDGTQEPKTKFEKVKGFLWQHRYEIAIGTGVVVSAVCLKKYLNYRKHGKLEAAGAVDAMSGDSIEAGLEQEKEVGAVIKVLARYGKRMVQQFQCDWKDEERGNQAFREI